MALEWLTSLEVVHAFLGGMGVDSPDPNVLAGCMGMGVWKEG